MNQPEEPTLREDLWQRKSMSNLLTTSPTKCPIDLVISELFLSRKYLHKGLVEVNNFIIFLSTEQKSADNLPCFVPALDVAQMYL